MPIYKNVTGQKLAVFAWDTGNDAEKTGDAANITAQISLDGGAMAALGDEHPAELDATNAPGVYVFDLAQAETNGNLVIVFAKSSTSNIKLEPVIAYTTPTLNDISSGDVETAVGTALATYDPPTKAELDNGLAGLNDLSSGDVQSAAAAALTAYDPPTKAELDSAVSLLATGAAVAALNNLSQAQAQAAATAALNAYDPPTKAELDAAVSPLATGAAVAALNNLSSAQAQSAATAALNAYDPPTKAELDSAVSPLATGAAVAALNNLSSAQAQSAAAAALNAYDPPTKAELDSAVSSLATGVNLATVDTVVDGIKVVMDKLGTTLELDGAVYRFTENALEQGPAGAGGGGDATAANQTTIIAHLTDIKGTGFAKDVDSLTDLAHTGADGDTLETLSDQLDGVGSQAGAGAITWTYTLTEAGTGTPIADADVWVTSDAAGTNVLASGKTSQAGVVTFFLDAGTVYVWRQKSGWNFTNPDTEAVS